MGNTRRETPTPRTLHAEVSNSSDAVTNGSFSKNSIAQPNAEYKKKLPRERADAENRTGSNSRGSESSNTSLRDDSSSITPNISNRINIVNQIPEDEEKEPSYCGAICFRGSHCKYSAFSSVHRYGSTGKLCCQIFKINETGSSRGDGHQENPTDVQPSYGGTPVSDGSIP